ncbi:cupin domain-containing protein [Rhizobium leguminosarum]|uniref:cupin domain-containing protein n=1 Tax=Rhizobium leguminosarum TaxID=384 RepID=UPI001C964F00|nr:cupin domain-containing protein [Rhizobium leguminosarum]MBY5827818.1 cupin domain-containing protein [Rhizobium leguminosarum]
MKRIVTANDNAGNARFVDEMDSPLVVYFDYVPGFSVSRLWSTSADVIIPETVTDEALSFSSFVPGPGETRCIMVEFPPDEVLGKITDWASVGAEYAAKLPGLAERFEADSPGMHTTPTIDHVVMLSSELWLELDGGKQRRLTAGDIVVQNGARHAWRNQSDGPARILSVMIGASILPSSDKAADLPGSSS